MNLEKPKYWFVNERMIKRWNWSSNHWYYLWMCEGSTKEIAHTVERLLNSDNLKIRERAIYQVMVRNDPEVPHYKTVYQAYTWRDFTNYTIFDWIHSKWANSDCNIQRHNHVRERKTRQYLHYIKDEIISDLTEI